MTSAFLPGNTFLAFDNVTIRQYDKEIFQNTNWKICDGEQWAIVGNNASGKTTLLQTILGKYPVARGNLHYYFYEKWKQKNPEKRDIYFTHLIALVNFNAGQILHRHPDMYYQQRFHATETQGNITVKDFLAETREQIPGETITSSIVELAQRLEIEYLLERDINKLSNGESKKLLIVQALLKKPLLLLLDYPFTGLDEAARNMLQQLLQKIAAQGVMIIISTMPDEIPDITTHVLHIENLQVKSIFTKENYLSQRAELFATEFNFQLKNKLPLQNNFSEKIIFDDAVKMQNVQVKYDNIAVLHNINWQVKRGECWALLGPNGSGKSTLLSLITADNPQAYANEIYLFDRRRGSGESIWEIKRKIGYVSPELHIYYQQNISCFNIIYSGFSDTMGIPAALDESLFKVVSDYLKMLDIAYLKDRSFLKISNGEQRMVLLARALVKHPPLLILDEPCQGLDNYHTEKMKWITDQICRHQQKTLIYVTHYKNEIPACVTHLLQLQKGEIIYCGEYK